MVLEKWHQVEQARTINAGRKSGERHEPTTNTISITNFIGPAILLTASFGSRLIISTSDSSGLLNEDVLSFSHRLQQIRTYQVACLGPTPVCHKTRTSLFSDS